MQYVICQSCFYCAFFVADRQWQWMWFQKKCQWMLLLLSVTTGKTATFGPVETVQGVGAFDGVLPLARTAPEIRCQVVGQDHRGEGRGWGGVRRRSHK